MRCCHFPSSKSAPCVMPFLHFQKQKGKVITLLQIHKCEICDQIVNSWASNNIHRGQAEPQRQEQRQKTDPPFVTLSTSKNVSSNCFHLIVSQPRWTWVRWPSRIYYPFLLLLIIQTDKDTSRFTNGQKLYYQLQFPTKFFVCSHPTKEGVWLSFDWGHVKHLTLLLIRNCYY